MYLYMCVYLCIYTGWNDKNCHLKENNTTALFLKFYLKNQFM